MSLDHGLGLDLDYGDDQRALADALARFLSERCDEAVVRAAAERFPRVLWSELAALGVLAAGSPAGEGGALEIAAVMEALGRAACPGPLVGSFVALQLLRGAERDAVAEGRVLVAYGEPPLLPFAPEAGLFLVRDGARVRRAEPLGAVEAVTVLGGEPWGRVRLRLGEELPGGARAQLVGEIARAAYLVALAGQLVDEVADYARSRRQFGRAIGEFQAVAHPLAEVWMRLAAARTLARAAAAELDAGALARAESLGASARLSASAAAVEAAHVAHQSYGALGITLEGPAFHRTRRIRQLASEPPRADVARARLLERMGLGESGRRAGAGA